LNGKAALVTGGGRGIGAGIAKRLARDGADVAVTYVRGAEAAQDVVRAIEAMGRRGLAVQADAADPAAVTAAVDQVASAFGRLDILVNNAGTFIPGGIGEVTIEMYDQTFGTNVRGLFAATVAAARRMGEGGRIINIGSINADRMPFPGGAVYAASKAAVHGLTRGFARDLGPRGITINTVQPGPVDTDLNPDNSEFAVMLKAQMAVPRYAHADEVAAMVAYLAGPETAMVTGSTLTIDGGFGA
jgi:3-oxoacyl-[acyl-carrier protein] reductase